VTHYVFLDKKSKNTTTTKQKSNIKTLAGAGDWFKHILLNYKDTLLTQIYKHVKQWIGTKDDDLIEFFSRYIQV